MADPLPLLILLVVGFVAGVINVIAGGGSFLTLPVLIFLGLPATVANGTNRIGVLTQNVSAVWGFHRFQVLDWRWALIVSVPSAIGGIVGAWAALQIGDDAFRRILSVVMVVLTVATLFAPDPVTRRRDVRSPTSWLVMIGFFFVGVYGGFLQAGVGLMILTMTTWSGIDLVRGNAIKVLSNSLLTFLALAIFATQARVHWPFGIALGVGNLLGGQVGVHLAVGRGHAWIKGVLTATVIVLAIRLWFS